MRMQLSRLTDTRVCSGERMADCHCFMPAPTKFSIIVAFAALYLIWGSTYLGIRFAIETIPPFLMAGTRFLMAGLILYVWARSRGAERPSLLNSKAVAAVGRLLLFG